MPYAGHDTVEDFAKDHPTDFNPHAPTRGMTSASGRAIELKQFQSTCPYTGHDIQGGM